MCSFPRHRLVVLSFALVLVLAMSLPVSAAILTQEEEEEEAVTVSSFSKNSTVTEVISFSKDDFRVLGDGSATLDSIMISSLPDQEAGLLMIGDSPLACGDIVSISAVEGVRFYPLATPTVASTSFWFTPIFSNGESGEQVNVNLYLLNAENNSPMAENLEFSTYKNVAYTGQFTAIDPEGDLITFQLVDKPARGSVKMPEEGSAEFIYTPYENKTGKDSFTFVAVDSVGNISTEATVKIVIEKPSTKVMYADMNGHPAYNAAIKLAEKGIYIGASMDGAYYFQPDQLVSKSEFLALAMSVVGLEELEGVTTTGFQDDSMIATWAKPYVASALKSGMIQGSVTSDGSVVFGGGQYITEAEAAVLLDRMLVVTDIAIETWAASVSHVPAWASQSVVNLETVGVLQTDATGTLQLKETLTRADAAQLLAAAMNVIESREAEGGWFHW